MPPQQGKLTSKISLSENEPEKVRAQLQNEIERLKTTIKELQDEVDSLKSEKDKTSSSCESCNKQRTQLNQVIKGIQQALPLPLNVGNNLMGVAWLENKIYVVYSDAKKVGVHNDQIPFHQHLDEELVIKFIEKPDDIASCSANRCLFISDYSANQCIWKIQMPAREVRRYAVNGKPCKLSTTDCDQLLAIVRGEQSAFLEIYKTSSGSHLQTVHFCEEIKLPVKAFQLPTGNLVVLYGETRPQAPNRRRYLISETTDSGQVVRTCDISKNDKTSRVSPTLSHMTLDDEGRLYVADSDNGRVIIVDRDFETCQVAAVKIDQPYRLCYVRERRMLIVGQWSPASMTLLHFSSTNDTCQHAS